MRKIGIFVLFAVAAVTVAGRGVTPVQAFPEFKKEFDNKYVKKEPATDAERSLKEAAEKAKCAICHIDPEKDKKHRNKYGEAISKHIPADTDKKALKKDVPKIIELLDKAAKESSNPDNPGAPTFGERIKEGKLPTGE